MRYIAGAIIVLAAVVLLVGWRATAHHKTCHPTSGLLGKACP